MKSPFDTLFGPVVEDINCPLNTVYLFSPRYKTVPVGTGEPPKFKEVIDWDATAKASAVLYNIGESYEDHLPHSDDEQAS